MALTLIYRMFVTFMRWVVLRSRRDRANKTEILGLRHQLAVLPAPHARPRMRWTDRAVIAALARPLPADRRRGLLVTPSTILRWHRHLTANR